MIQRKNMRERMFRAGKPTIRRFDEKRDMWVLWGAYDLGSFKNLPAGMKREEFWQHVVAVLQMHSSCLVVEDRCRYFRGGTGPVAFMTVNNFGWRIEPHIEFFYWTTHRMMLRSIVTFLQMVRYSKEVGICEVRAMEPSRNLFEHVKNYVPLDYCGKIPRGDPRGHSYLYSIIGGRRAGTHGAGRGTGLERDDHGAGAEATGEKRNDAVPGPDVLRVEGRKVRDRRAEEAGRESGERAVHSSSASSATVGAAA